MMPVACWISVCTRCILWMYKYTTIISALSWDKADIGRYVYHSSFAGAWRIPHNLLVQQLYLCVFTEPVNRFSSSCFSASTPPLSLHSSFLLDASRSLWLWKNKLTDSMKGCKTFFVWFTFSRLDKFYFI